MTIALDVAIGVVFVFLSLALIVTTLQELIASGLRWRAKDLYATIEGMLKSGNADDAPELVRKLYAHPLIGNLAKKPLAATAELRGNSLPSYIPSKTFALALLDVLQDKTTATKVIGADKVLANAAQIVQSLPAGGLKSSLELLVTNVEKRSKDFDDTADQIGARIESWFNDRMARAAGWYKRKMQLVSLALAGGVTLACNADSLKIATTLWKDSALRNSIVSAAQGLQSAETAKAGTDVASLATSVVDQGNTLLKSGLPIGWGAFNATDAKDLALAIAGWAVTTLAVSLGAGFWFDVLNKALNIRGGGAKVSSVTGAVEKG
jgi:hypothetical protein